MHCAWLMRPSIVLFTCLAACQSSDPDPLGERAGKADAYSETCPFSDTLSASVDEGLVELTHVKTLTGDSPLSGVEKDQIMNFFEIYGAQSASDAIESLTEDSELDVYTALTVSTGHDPFTVYRFSAGGNPMGFIYVKDSLQFVAEIEDGLINCVGLPSPNDGCKLDGVLEVAGDWPSFSVWSLELDDGRLVDSFTDDLRADEWQTTHIRDSDGNLQSFIQITDASDAIITTVLHLRTENCDPLLGPDIELVGATTTFADHEGTYVEVHEVHMK